MWIIFDLDDTLIDTSGSITPFKLQESLLAMKQAGLICHGHELEELIHLNSLYHRTRETIRRFVEMKGGEKEIMVAGLHALTTPLPRDFSVRTRPFAKEIISYCAQEHTIALVTGGHPPFQLEKLKKAGLDEALFSKIAIPPDSVKKPIFQAFAQEWGASPRDVVVVGDRIDLDLEPARALGFTTVHVRWGRGLQVETPAWVDHQILELDELKRIV